MHPAPAWGSSRGAAHARARDTASTCTATAIDAGSSRTKAACGSVGTPAANRSDETVEHHDQAMEKGHAIVLALWDGQNAALTLATSGAPNIEALDRWAEMMDVLRVEV